MSMRDVLAVLDHREERLESTFDAALALAEEERSRLTLVQCCEPPNIHLWLSPYAVGAVYVPADEDPQVTAARTLAATADRVPREIPLTTMLVTGDTRKQLCQLVHSGAFDALVAPAAMLRRARRLGRELRSLGMRVIPVHCEPVSCDAAASESPRPERPVLAPVSLGLHPGAARQGSG